MTAARDKRGATGRGARGIAPRTLVSQVRGTASWLWGDARAQAITQWFDRFAEDESRPDDASYLRLLLSAHWATVGTFVPTDVDVRIRHHTWVEIDDADRLEEACAIVDEIASLPASIASARVVESKHGALSGHDGEWLGVRAGALGRALALGASALSERLQGQLDHELDREERIFEEAWTSTRESAARLLPIATTIAHNLGDLSRVVEQWPKQTPPEVASRYTRLGHPDSPSPRRSFVIAGVLNKSLSAHENHRFLPLRKPRALRASRTFLLPFGPWFDAWGTTIATTDLLEDRDRGEVFEALLDIHHARPDEHGCLRALSAMHRSLRGGLEKLVPELPARMRKEALRGRVREALDVTEEHFSARMDRRLRSEIERL